MSEKTYVVTRPFAGSVTVEVEADSESEASEKAVELFNNVTIDFKSNDGVEMNEWEIYEKLVQGNVCYVQPYEEEIEEI